jgi:hypothetical protein
LPVTTTYEFSQAANAFFEMPTDLARQLLPAHLQPLELRHESSIFAVTAFDFTGSEVGAYTEVVLAVIVPPMVKEGGVFPKSAFFPFVVGTSTPESRQHAIERWHLPHHMSDIQVDFAEAGSAMKIAVREAAAPILDFSISAHKWAPVDQLYQCFMVDGPERFKVDMHLRGEFTEHEEESGMLALHDHAMTSRLDADEIRPFPFREMWMRNGIQVFEELETL